MADAKEVEAKGPKAASHLPLIVMALAMVVTVLGAVGGGMFWLVKSGRLGAAAAPVQAAEREPAKTKLMGLDPLLVNLQDQGGAGYLRVVMVLRVDDPPPAKGEKPKEEKPAEKGKVVINEDEAVLRDAALTVMSRETSDVLLAPDGKEHLKTVLLASFKEHAPTVKVTDVLFTEFLVQR